MSNRSLQNIPGKALCLVLLLFGAVPSGLMGQCGPAAIPDGLNATVAPGGGVLLEWTAVPGSAGVALRANAPAGLGFSRRLMGPGVDQFNIPDGALAPGHYQWWVQGACSALPPYALTGVSALGSFTISSADCPATVVDVDGNSYPTVQISTQCWMAQNLRASAFANGEPIPTGLSNTDWANDTDGAYAVYQDDTSNLAAYGHLYNWHAVVNPRGICPLGWHVPSDAEWDSLKLHLRLLGGPAGDRMKSVGTLGDGTGLWLAPNAGATNSSGFNGNPSGVRNYIGNYFAQGLSAIWWSSTEKSGPKAFIRFAYYNEPHLGRNSDIKEVGQSVRCLRD